VTGERTQELRDRGWSVVVHDLLGTEAADVVGVVG